MGPDSQILVTLLVSYTSQLLRCCWCFLEYQLTRWRIFCFIKKFDEWILTILLSRHQHFVAQLCMFYILFHIFKIPAWYTWIVCHLFLRNFLFFFIIQCVKVHVVPCPHQPPTRSDNTVSVAQGSTATPGATKQLLPPDRVLRELYIYIYIYMPDQIRAKTTLDVNLHF